MLIAQIEGGLASQMFGYAVARSLALTHGVEVFIDARNFRTYKKFEPELHHLDVDATLLTNEQADEICGLYNERIPIIRPSSLRFDPGVMDHSLGLMIGNFLSEDYFAEHDDVIRRDFRRVSEPTRYALAMTDELADIRARGYEPVSVHIRRGDYVTDAAANRTHGVLDLEYYDRAIALIRKTINNPWFVFFSNDTEWLADTFEFDNQTIARPRRDTPPVEDMLLMASCSHNVLANSGYSWWAAWLNARTDKIVVCPRPWLLDATLQGEQIPCRDWLSIGSTHRHNSKVIT